MIRPLPPTLQILLATFALAGTVAALSAGCGDSRKADKGDAGPGGLDASLGVDPDAAARESALTEDQALHVCVAFSTCFAGTFNGRYGVASNLGVKDGPVGNLLEQCMSSWLDHVSPAQAQCVLDAKGSCGGVSKCLGLNLASSCPSPAPLNALYCKNDTQIYCNAQGTAHWEQACDPWFGGAGSGCSTPDADAGVVPTRCNLGTCDTIEPQPACTGNRVTRCVADAFYDGGVRQTLQNCEAFGDICRSGGTLAQATCAGAGPKCEADTNSCEGRARVTCVNGYKHVLDCGYNVAGRSCTTYAGATDAGVGKTVSLCGFGGSSECDPWGTQDDGIACDMDGKTLIACVGGKQYRVDCTALGFGACVANRGCTGM